MRGEGRERGKEGGCIIGGKGTKRDVLDKKGMCVKALA